jgi:putative FmdB family regulatory protein
MPIFEYECAKCGSVFEVIVKKDKDQTPCENCGNKDTRKLDGKFSEATRFADKAASMVKSDKVKRVAGKLHKKTGK